MADAAAHSHPRYFLIWFYLAALTGVELWVATFNWAKTTLILVLLFLAVWKALLVALYFMHLKYESTRIKVLAAAPLPLAVILVIAVIQEFR